MDPHGGKRSKRRASFGEKMEGWFVLLIEILQVGAGTGPGTRIEFGKTNVNSIECEQLGTINNIMRIP